MNKYIRMITVLVTISMVAGGVLALSYEITNPKTLEQAKLAQERAVIKVIPGSEKIVSVEKGGMEFFIGEDEKGSKMGIAFEARGMGFNGPINIMVGYDPAEGRLLGIDILAMTETPGLGAKIEEAAFTDQFTGKSVLDNFIPKEDVNAITGATVSPRGVATGIKAALEKVLEIYPVGVEIQ